MSFLSRMSVDKRAKVDEEGMQHAPFENIQQKVMQKIMSNPRLMAQMIPIMGGQQPDY